MKEQSANERIGCSLLWLGVLLPPIAWLVQFQIRYSLVEWICLRQSRLALHVVSLGCFLVIAAAGWLCWRSWTRHSEQIPNADGLVAHERNLFLASLGMLSSALFALTLIAQTVPEIMINPCQK